MESRRYRTLPDWTTNDRRLRDGDNGGMTMPPVLFGILWLISIAATGVVAHRKRRLVRSWVAGAVFTGWFALLLISVLPPLPEPGNEPEALAQRIAQLEQQLASRPQATE